MKHEWEQVSPIRRRRQRADGSWVNIFRRHNDWAVTLTAREPLFIDLLRLPVSLEGFGSLDEARCAANAHYFPQEEDGVRVVDLG